ncbi:MAG: hypothetical protein PHC61_09255 [Chitinivibrionales bacterium]|nr:hypothetical protein [Chitinivibrionales bacterium]
MDYDKVELASYWDEGKEKIIRITVLDYKTYLENKDKDKISSFLFQRLHSRYINPFKFESDDFKKKNKNGFAMMATYCLLIETLQSFKNGWGDSDKKSEKAFKQFFTNNPHFKELKDLGGKFYKQIRCGILHQGETIGGWKISREGIALFKENTIDAVLFGERLELSLKDYCDNLRFKEWDSEIWDNFRVKMRKIILNTIPNS